MSLERQMRPGGSIQNQNKRLMPISILITDNRFVGNLSWLSCKQKAGNKKLVKSQIYYFFFRNGASITHFTRMCQWSRTFISCRFPVSGRPTIWNIVGQGPIALAVGAVGGLFGHFPFLYLFSPLSPSLWETARYRLKYCLKGLLNPKQPTKQA